MFWLVTENLLFIISISIKTENPITRRNTKTRNDILGENIEKRILKIT